MHLMTSVLPILTVLPGSAVGTTQDVVSEEDLLNEHFIEMNQENIKLFHSAGEESIYVDEDDLEKELAESEKTRMSLTKLVVIIAVLTLVSLIALCVIVIFCRRRSRLWYRRREEDKTGNGSVDNGEN